MNSKFFSLLRLNLHSGRVKLFSCSVACWDAHLPNTRHRNAAAIEEIARPGSQKAVTGPSRRVLPGTRDLQVPLSGSGDWPSISPLSHAAPIFSATDPTGARAGFFIPAAGSFPRRSFMPVATHARNPRDALDRGLGHGRADPPVHPPSDAAPRGGRCSGVSIR